MRRMKLTPKEYRLQKYLDSLKPKYNPFDRYNPQPIRDVVTQTSNVGSRQINRKILPHQSFANIPRYLRDRASQTGLLYVDFFANSGASSGPFIASEDLETSVGCPTIFTMYLGQFDKSGAVLEDGGSIVNKYINVVGGTAVITNNDREITATVDTVNVGWPSLITAVFAFMVFTDDTLLKEQVG